MTGETHNHIVFVSATGMTHARPLLHFGARLLTKFPSLFISFYTAQDLAAQCETYLTQLHPAIASRVRIVPAPIEKAGHDLLARTLALEQTFGPWISKQLTSTTAELNGLVVAAPHYIIEDHHNGGVALANKQYHKLPIASWWVATVVSFLTLLGTKQIGDRIQAEWGPESEKKQLSKETMSNRLVLTSALPPFYEHEWPTQDLGHLMKSMAPFVERRDNMLQYTDKLVVAGINEMEPIVIEALVTAFPKITVYSPGLETDLPRAKPHGHIDNQTSDPVLQFMNRAYMELGPHSVVYIAFGTLFFPPAESAVYLRVIIDEIVAQGLRVVFSVKSEYAQIAGLDEEYTSKLTEAGQAMFPEWVQQLEVLEHPATHYFMSHGGWNSTAEAIVRGVPQIFWPMGGDQPINSIHMTKQHDCGFELLQVRTGGAKSVAYTDYGDVQIPGSADAVRSEIRKIIAFTKGARGEQQRRNMKTLGQVAVRATETGGSGDVALGKFGTDVGL